jgi:2-methylcitrate dehydratase PrpD
MAFALELGKLVNSLRYEDLPPEAVYWAKAGILDTVGATLAGAIDPAATIVQQTLPEAPGPSLVYGTDRRTTPMDAALANGTAAHALDFDDASNTLGGHPSVPILPALFALADETGAGGKDFITAYVAGFETECKLSMGVNFYQYEHGWHPTSTLGVFGAAAACAHLLGLDDEGTATALGIAASLASGIKSNFGSMVKPLHVGQCARNGLFAALLARNGFTASPVAFEHKQGYFEVFNGSGNYDASKILPAWANPLDIVSPGIAVKQYPCCGSTHPAIDATLALTRAHHLQPEQIERIESWTHPRRLNHTNRPDPQTPEDAAFSVQYCVARAIVDGKVLVDHFEEDSYRDERVLEVMRRVEAAPYTTAQFPAENHFGAEVRITLLDGTVLDHKVDSALGRTSANPIPQKALETKFRGNAARLLPPVRIDSLVETFENFETMRDAGIVSRIISGEA